MPFAQRNLHYLRASPHVVLQTILYLDPSDLRWMNSPSNGVGDDDGDGDIDLTRDDGRYETRRGDDEQVAITGDDVWSRALNHLRDKIMPKLREEAEPGGNLATTGSSAKVSLHIDVDFQMAYFFRPTTGKHAVLLKNKELIFPRKVEMPPPAFPASAFNRPAVAPLQQQLPPSRLAERQEREDELLVNAPFDGSAAIVADDQATAQRKRRRSPAAELLDDVRVKDEDEDDEVQLANLVVEEQQGNLEEQANAIDVDEMADDKKPRLYVTYSGFQIFGKCLVVVIEPTRRTRTLRKGLFRAKTNAERHQLSAKPITAEERTASVAPTGRSSERASSRQARSTRAASVTSTADGNDDDDDALNRADSRRLGSRSSSRLFRGTPSDWEPTPSPAPPDRRRIFGSGTTTFAGHDSPEAADDDNAEEADKSTSMTLATQMMDRVSSTYVGDDLDDD